MTCVLPSMCHVNKKGLHYSKEVHVHERKSGNGAFLSSLERISHAFGNDRLLVKSECTF